MADALSYIHEDRDVSLELQAITIANVLDVATISDKVTNDLKLSMIISSLESDPQSKPGWSLV